MTVESESLRAAGGASAFSRPFRPHVACDGEDDHE
jgi:hypothetical protein